MYIPQQQQQKKRIVWPFFVIRNGENVAVNYSLYAKPYIILWGWNQPSIPCEGLGLKCVRGGSEWATGKAILIILSKEGKRKHGVGFLY